jgi:hypothetical protein
MRWLTFGARRGGAGGIGSEREAVGETDLPDCQGMVGRGIEQHRQLCKPRAHMTPRDRRSRQRQFLTVRVRNDELRVRGLKTPTILLNPTENIVNIVGEEPFSVEHGLDQTGNRSQRHVLRMCVSVPLESQDVSRFRGKREEMILRDVA